MSKLHFYDPSVISDAPEFIKFQFRLKGEAGTICGYVRKTTTDKEKVTCFYCLRRMKEQNII